MKTHLLVKLLGCIAVSLGSMTTCFAQDKLEWNWSGSLDVRSQYIGGMTGSTMVTESVVQPSITLSHGSCYANAWMSMHAIDPVNIRKGDEVDGSAGCAWSMGVIKNDFTLLYYNLYPLSTSRGDLFAVRDTLIFPKLAGWNTSLALEYDIPENKHVLPGGFLYKAEYYREIPIEEKKVVASFAIGGHDGAYGLKPEVVSFVRGTVSMPIAIKSVIVSPSLMLQWGAKKGGLADNQAVLGINMSWP